MAGSATSKTTGEDDYLAFISYPHADNLEDDRKWASWLHSQLEAYEIPGDLIGTTNARGEAIPARLYPIFRDELSLPADASLATSVAHALECSRFLVVLCSPRAVDSRYVKDEILRYKALGRSDRIIAVIIDGAPNANSGTTETTSRECFPAPLLFELGNDGQIDHSRKTEPIAADFRLPDGSEGFTNPGVYRRRLEQSGIPSKEARRRGDVYEQRLNNARLKVLAGILGVSPERLTRRDKAYQLTKAKAEAKRSRRIASAMTVLTLIAVVTGIYAYRQFQRAEASLADLRGNLAFMNTDLRRVLANYVPTNRREPITKQLDHVVEALAENEDKSEAGQFEIARAAKIKADGLRSSDLDGALALYQRSLLMHRELANAAPDDMARQHAVTVTLIELGDLHLDRSELDRAASYYQEATAIRQRLVDGAPDQIRWRRELMASRNRESIVLQKQRKFDLALEKLAISRDDAEAVLKNDPSDTEAVRDLYVAWNLIGNTQEQAESIPKALKAFTTGIRVNKDALAKDGANIRLRRDLSVSHTNVGDVMFKSRDLRGATEQYQLGMTQAEHMRTVDPTHPMLIADLAGNHVGLGRVLESTDPDEAMQHFVRARELLKPVIEAGQLDDDRVDFPKIIGAGIARLEARDEH